MKTELSIVMPCLNEALTIGVCIEKAKQSLIKHGIEGEIVIGDNGSTDGSIKIAQELGAKVVHVTKKGYGNALRGAIEQSEGKYIIMGDSDDSYDFSDLYPFVEKLRQGYELVMGNRFKGGIEEGAMPFLHKYLGNPVLSFLGRLFFGSKIGDFNCGLRGFSKEAYLKMSTQATGMEFASELVMKASLLKLKVTEVPTKLKKDGRGRPPHLRTWRDGWRNLRFMLMYAPSWLFLIPGVTMIIVGLAVSLALLAGPITIGQVRFDVSTLLYMSILVLIGVQFVFFYIHARTFGINSGFLPPSERFEKSMAPISLEFGIAVSLFFLVVGVVGAFLSLDYWSDHQFGDLNISDALRRVIPSAMSIGLGFQILLASFFNSILGLWKRTNN